jgi:hypothetical protein
MGEDLKTSFSPEQLAELTRMIHGDRPAAVGLAGTPVTKPGLGCGAESMGPLAAGVYSMLAAGSPRLALAKAMGIPLAPWMINVRAVFPDTSTPQVPDVGGDVKITQDTLIDSVRFRIFNQSVTANQNQFQAQSDWYYNWQSGIEATLSVMGAPRYDVAPRFMPLALLADAFNGDARVGGGWILTYQNQVKMAFQAKVTIPVAPIEVVVTFSAWVPVWDELVQMTNREAIYRLKNNCGIVLEDAYANRCCR